jgi:phage tail tape-measure protein
MRIVAQLALAAGLLCLVSCGSNEPERAQGGAATGAATGAAVGIIGGPVGILAGGLIGGAAGATTGAVTSPSDINLGPPPWSNSP